MPSPKLENLLRIGLLMEHADDKASQGNRVALIEGLQGVGVVRRQLLHQFRVGLPDLARVTLYVHESLP